MMAAVALNRFGLGARAGDALPDDPKRWLIGQFDRFEARPVAWSSQPDTTSIATSYVAERQELQSMRADAKAQGMDRPDMDRADMRKAEDVQAARKQMRQDGRQTYLDAVNARAASALVSPAPFIEHLAHFWANHFAVSSEKAVVTPFVGAYEMEAIRPHVLGRFEDMLLAVERHAAMQLYLDQAQSVGPSSPFATRAATRNPERKAGLNENLAREILELHTLGVRSGYSQADVTEFARALTGWSIGGLGRGGGREQAAAGSFQFRPALHEPGTRTIIGKIYAQPGEEQARAVLGDLARAPATANHIAAKLARHFVADDPPPALVDRLATSFLKSDGDLPTVYRALIEAPESWAPSQAKFKTPWEWLISAMRGVGTRDLGEVKVANMMQQLGQPVWRPGSPAGYDDIAASWAAPDALVRRVEVAQRIAMRVGDRLDARTLAPKLLPETLTPATAQAIARAESPPTGLSLLLVSPEFQRR